MRRSPYVIAFVLAVVMFVLVAPEVNEGNAMDPTIQDGQILVVSKTAFSENRGAPDRGQIVILEKLAARGVSEDNLIARVAGLPGETVTVKKGEILIDGEPYVTENGISGAGALEEMQVELTDSQVFLLCDNREELMDSRNNALGAVELTDIKGKVLFSVWPFSRLGGIE